MERNEWIVGMEGMGGKGRMREGDLTGKIMCQGAYSIACMS